ncbi:MAG TPA: type II secretion system F family protein [Terracidiphilus sp.]|nr:type II secretion system F family protein [Terracidiphilus sp.]
MTIVFVLVFLGVFAVIALPLIAAGSARTSKQVLASLDSALSTDAPSTREQILNIRKDSAMSSIPWLNKKLLQFQIAPSLQKLISQADLKWTAGRLLAMTGLCFVVPAYGIYVEFKNGPIALLIGLAIGAAPIGWVMFLRSRRFLKFQEGLPEALDLMVSALRAGHSLIAAMGLVARECPDPVGVEFRGCFEEQNYGLELKVALDNMMQRIPIQDLAIVATAIMIQKESGGNLAEVLDKTSHVIRERFRLQRQVKVHTAQGRLTGWILTLLPVVLAILLYFINPNMMSVLWHKPMGIKLIWISVGMIFVGGLVIRKIVTLDY